MARAPEAASMQRGVPEVPLGDFPATRGGLRLRLPVSDSQLQVPVSCGPRRDAGEGETKTARLPSSEAGPLSSPGRERPPPPGVSQV